MTINITCHRPGKRVSLVGFVLVFFFFFYRENAFFFSTLAAQTARRRKEKNKLRKEHEGNVIYERKNSAGEKVSGKGKGKSGKERKHGKGARKREKIGSNTGENE